MDFSQTSILFYIMIVTQIIALVVAIRKPNENQNLQINTLNNQMDTFGKYLQEMKENIHEVSNTFVLFKENEFRHIEKDMNDLKIDVAKKFENIITVLSERLPKNNNGLKK